MTHLIPRTCTLVTQDHQHISSPLKDYRNSFAYVLLGEPGMGKTSTFEQEAQQFGCQYIKAWDLITFDDRPEWHDKTLFIDGLDEVRAGSGDVKEPFHAIRNKLEKLGQPKFRLSCREADWLGESDRKHLQQVVPDTKEIEELHLDELTEDDIREILVKNYHKEISNSPAFIKEAKERELGKLIKNPQVLAMLVAAVQGIGQWPESRRETFELACHKILTPEHNEEHQITPQTSTQSVNKQLDAAGYLCALSLLSDKPKFARTILDSTDEYPFLNNLEYEDQELLHAVIKTKLFDTNSKYTSYIHRTVAEYLAARYLKKQIEEGFPIGRVLALMIGKDGVAVAGLRGLFAWLVTLSEKHRSILISRDPLGLILYGDVQSFRQGEKKEILEALKCEAKRYSNFRAHDWAEHPFGALCTSDMEQIFRGIFISVDRSEPQQVLVDCVLDAMMHGSKLPGLSNCLLEIVRDSNRWPGVRRQALYVYIRVTENEPEQSKQLMQLVADADIASIEDLEDDLLGVLLKELYPLTITPNNIFDYLHTPKKSNYIGSYRYFWLHHLEDKTSDTQMLQLMDELVSHRENIIGILDDIDFSSLIGRLLRRGIKAHGENIQVERLYEWLGLGLDEQGFSLLSSQEELSSISEWISTHPDIQKSLIKYQSANCLSNEDFGWCMHVIMERFYRAVPPGDYGLWCLNMAEEMNEDNASQYFTEEAVRTLYNGRGSDGLSLELLEKIIEESPRLSPWIENMLVAKADRGDREYKIKQREYRKEQEKQKSEYIQTIKKNIDAIEAGTVETGILHNLGMAYYGRFVDFNGKTPYERLRNYFDDEDIVSSILEGFQNSLEREDLPEVEEIFDINMRERISTLSHPFRAGLAELCKTDDRSILQLSEDKLRKALAFYFADEFEQTAWYMELVKERPELVSEILVKYVSRAVRAKKQYVPTIWSLAFDENHENIARYSAIPLLKSFPVRCSNKQLEMLDHLLKAALQYSETDELLSLIEEKLALRSMNVSQYVHWLGAAFVVSPSSFTQALIDYISGNARRINYLAGFFVHRSEQVSLIEHLPDFALALLIRLFGSYFFPHRWDSGDGHVTAAMHNADLVNSMINKLSTINRDSATKEIDSLMKDQKLHNWYRTLQGALYQQQSNKREAQFSHPSIGQVSNTLQNLSPSNAADLAALVFEHIKDLAAQIEDGNTISYKEFWNTDKHNKPVKRRHEEACRDTFLAYLKERLKPLGVDAIKEAYYASEKRADIRVSYGGAGGYNVPIEIKCNDHKDLWYAIHNQLIGKYTRDPNTHGYGIYMVFWFGQDGMPPPPEGTSPRTASELKKRLHELLKDEQERRQISICVIDCSFTGK